MTTIKYPNALAKCRSIKDTSWTTTRAPMGER